jgi:TetR/AcrR family transcriptional regulator, transcriptional repressor for nem operon
MARPREFDPDAVVDRAMQVFWTKGFEATSLDDLCASTGLNRSSLYAAFGDKRALFLETLERYGDRAVARITAALSRPVRIGEALAGFLAEIIEQIVAGPGRSGCLIGNCAAEVAPHDRAAAASVRRNLQRVEAAFRDGFARAKARGEFASDTDIDALARFFVATTQGLRVIGKSTADRGVLEDIARVMLRTLDV